MSRGWQELRLEPDGRWTPTGALRDKGQWPPPQLLHPIGHQAITVVEGVDTLKQPREITCLADPGIAPGVGTLGWAQFSRP